MGMAHKHKKMFNITDDQRNANQNHNQTEPPAIRMATIEQTKPQKIGEDVEEVEPLYTVGGNMSNMVHLL